MEAIIDRAKILLNIADFSKDEVLETLLELVDNEVVEYCGLASIDSTTSNLSGIRVSMLVYKYQRLGMEHIGSHSYSGVSESFITNYPKSIVNSLNAIRKNNRKLKVY